VQSEYNSSIYQSFLALDLDLVVFILSSSIFFWTHFFFVLYFFFSKIFLFFSSAAKKEKVSIKQVRAHVRIALLVPLQIN